MSKKQEPTYDTYEPGEPEDVTAKEKAAADKQDRHDRRVYYVKETFKWIAWISLILVVLGAIVFGINRWVHAANESTRKQQAFYAACVTSGNHQYYYEGTTICFNGTVTNADTNAGDGKNKCIAAGDYPVKADNGNSYFYLCVHGKIVSIL